MPQPDTIEPLDAALAVTGGLGIDFISTRTNQVGSRASISFTGFASEGLTLRQAALGLLAPSILGTTRTGRCVLPVTEVMVDDHVATPIGVGFDSASAVIDSVPFSNHLALRDGRLGPDGIEMSALLCDPVFTLPWSDDDADILRPAGLTLAGFVVQRMMSRIDQNDSPSALERTMMMRGLVAAFTAQMMLHSGRDQRRDNRDALRVHVDLLRDGILSSEGPACPAPPELDAPLDALLDALPRDINSVRALEDGPPDDASMHERMCHFADHEAVFDAIAALRGTAERVHRAAIGAA